MHFICTFGGKSQNNLWGHTFSLCNEYQNANLLTIVTKYFIVLDCIFEIIPKSCSYLLQNLNIYKKQQTTIKLVSSTEYTHNIYKETNFLKLLITLDYFKWNCVSYMLVHLNWPKEDTVSWIYVLFKVALIFIAIQLNNTTEQWNVIKSLGVNSWA